MSRKISLLAIAIILMASSVSAQSVIIRDFPLGKGMWTEEPYWQPYDSGLAMVADTMKQDSNLIILIDGGADANTYDENHDAKNAGTATSRANGAKERLVNKHGVDSTRIVITTTESRQKGGDHRYAIVSVASRYATMTDIQNLIDSLNQIVTVVDTHYVSDTTPRVTVIKQVYEGISVQIGTGYSAGANGHFTTGQFAIIAPNIGGIEVWGGHQYFGHTSATLFEHSTEMYCEGWGWKARFNIALAAEFFGKADSATVVNCPLEGIVGYQQIDNIYKITRKHEWRDTEWLVGIRLHLLKAFNIDSKWDIAAEANFAIGNTVFYDDFAAESYTSERLNLLIARTFF